MKMLFVGGSGFMGKSLYLHMRDRHQIRIMSRHRPEWLNDAEWIHGDIVNVATMRKTLSASFDVVADFAGIMNQKKQSYYEVNEIGTRNLSDALFTSKETKLVYISAINSDIGNTAYFRTKRAAEKNIMLHANYLVIRPSILYGEGDYTTKKLISTARRFVPVFPKTGFVCPVHISDFAKAFEGLLEETGCFDLHSSEMLRLGDMLNIIRRRMGKKDVPQVPMSLFKIASPLLESMGLITSEQLSMLRRDFNRGDSLLLKYVPNPMTYERFVENAIRP